MNRGWFIFLCLTIVIIGLFTNGKVIYKIGKDFIKETPRENADPREVCDNRYADIRRHLPSHGIVGLFGSTDFSNDHRLIRTRLREIEYSLAPLIIKPNEEHDIVIGDFFLMKSPPNTIPGHPNLKLIESSGNIGIYKHNHGDPK